MERRAILEVEKRRVRSGGAPSAEVATVGGLRQAPPPLMSAPTLDLDHPHLHFLSSSPFMAFSRRCSPQLGQQARARISGLHVLAGAASSVHSPLCLWVPQNSSAARILPAE